MANLYIYKFDIFAIHAFIFVANCLILFLPILVDSSLPSSSSGPVPPPPPAASKPPKSGFLAGLFGSKPKASSAPTAKPKKFKPRGTKVGKWRNLDECCKYDMSMYLCIYMYTC